ncbi:DUF2059 domain-containing protein [Sphingomonas oryzagri]
MRILILAIALIATPLAAQVTAAPDPTTLAAARDLMAATDIQGQMRALMPRMAEAAGTQLRQMFSDNKMPDGLQQQMTAAIQANMTAMQDVMTPQVINQMATVYARHFSADELKRLTALMRDPVMARFRTEMPNTMGEIMPIMFTAMKPRQEAFQVKMRRIIADWIKQHPEDKAKLRSPNAS